jgi:uncharacterized protein YuzB (UPF0349 family)
MIFFTKAGPIMSKINYCCKNFKHGSKSVYKTMKAEFPDMKQKKKDCLGNCKLCTKQCMVMIGKTEIIVAHSPEVLYEKIKQRIG